MQRAQIIQSIRHTLRKHGIKKAYLFGSFARGEKTYHDIDIAIRPPAHFSLMDMAGAQVDLEEAMGCQVDLVSTRALHPRLAPRIRREQVAIL